jgi:hypothetical protein
VFSVDVNLSSFLFSQEYEKPVHKKYYSFELQIFIFETRSTKTNNTQTYSCTFCFQITNNLALKKMNSRDTKTEKIKLSSPVKTNQE